MSELARPVAVPQTELRDPEVPEARGKLPAPEAPEALHRKTCVPCRGGVPPLKGEELQSLLKKLDSNWQVISDHHLQKEFVFKDFKEALAFTNQVGALAEKEGHHPDIHLTWGKVTITVWTHKIDGLTESDFILAAKIDIL